MVDQFISPIGFLFLLFLLAIGALGSLLLRKKDELANLWQSFFAIAGSVWGLFFSIGSLISGREITFVIQGSIFPLLSFSFHIDLLSAFFIFVISLITLFCSIYGIGYITHFYKKYNIGHLGFFYHAFIAGMLLVVSASNGLFFLIAWELMSIASYFLVVYDRNDENNVKAGFLYLVMTHIGTAFIILAFLLLYKYTGSFEFAQIKAGVTLIPSALKNIIFILTLIGFGTKAGIIPFHIWLPSAHPAAPSHVSALMSGVMIKTGVFMMIRIYFDLLHPLPIWWGMTVLLVGILSALLGVLYALTEHDIKRLLAFHSIENIGIILLGLGSAMIFLSLGNTPLALFGLGAALFHTLNHATFKSLLFLSAGSVIHQTQTRNMEEYGGLIKKMPRTAFFFLIGSMAISALPPFNGFFSEWLTFQTLLQGIVTSDFVTQTLFVLAAGALAITGGLALACFVKAFGASFLARPRSVDVELAKESSFSMTVGMGALAALCLLFGIFSGYLGSLSLKIAGNLKLFSHASPLLLHTSQSQLLAPSGFGAVSGPALFIFFLLTIFLVMVLSRFIINRNQRIRVGATWDCGTSLTSRMEMTATGFARSIILIFASVLRPSIKKEVELEESALKYFPKSRVVNLGIRDVYWEFFYQPLDRLISNLSFRVKKIQTGNINTYILYILITLVATLFFVAIHT